MGGCWVVVWVAGGLLVWVGEGEGDRWLWGCRMGSEAWIGRVWGEAEGRKRWWCIRRAWSGLKMPCLDFNECLNGCRWVEFAN